MDPITPWIRTRPDPGSVWIHTVEQDPKSGRCHWDGQEWTQIPERIDPIGWVEREIVRGRWGPGQHTVQVEGPGIDGYARVSACGPDDEPPRWPAPAADRPSTADRVTTAEAILDRARDLLGSDGSQWTRGAMARDEDGRPVTARDPAAVRWCLLGSLDRAGIEQTGTVRQWVRETPAYRRAVAAIRAVIETDRRSATSPAPLSGYNDHPEVEGRDVAETLSRARATLRHHND